MKTNLIQLNYQLAFDSPFHFGTGLRSGLVHRSVAYDPEGYLYVPGSTLKGVLRQQVGSFAQLFGIAIRDPHNIFGDLNEFSPQADITTLIFGSRYQPGTLYFDDALMNQEDRDVYDGAQTPKKYLQKQVENRTQVSLSRLTRTARPGMLFSSEYGQRELHFNGQISGSLSGVPLISKPNVTYSLLLLIAALMSLDRLGGGKSAGIGRANCTITALKVDSSIMDPTICVQELGDLELFELAQEEA